jgi:hypothetical protein
LRAGWRFVTKHLRVRAPAKCRVKSVTVFDATLCSPVEDRLLLRGVGYGILLRFERAAGMFACLQNPSNKIALDENNGRLSLAYEPDMEWDSAWGPFESDRACLGTYALSGTKVARNALRSTHGTRRKNAVPSRAARAVRGMSTASPTRRESSIIGPAPLIRFEQVPT